MEMGFWTVNNSLLATQIICHTQASYTNAHTQLISYAVYLAIYRAVEMEKMWKITLNQTTEEKNCYFNRKLQTNSKLDDFGD